MFFFYFLTVDSEVVIANCTDKDARLVDGPSASKGRLEVCVNHAWATVCRARFGILESTVVCGQLGFQRYGKRFPHVVMHAWL